MSKTTFRLKKQLFTYVRRGWIVIIIGILAILMALPISSTLAAPNNQTVPQPTPENTPKPVPTATPTDRQDDDKDDGDSSSQPAQPAQLPVSEDLIAVVNVERLNVRGGPSVQYDVIGKVNKDEVVTVIGRNEPGDWWFLCCVVDTAESGWVSAQFLTPNFSDEQIDTLPIIPADGPPPTPEPTLEPVAEAVTDTAPAGDTGMITTTIATTTATMPTSALELSMDQSTPFAWQGQEVKLQYVITNSSDVDAANVELRNELPLGLSYVDAAVSSGGEPVDSALGNGATIIGVRWPMLAAGEQATVTITLLISADAPNGAVIQNIAVAGADNAESVSAGVNIGMPPAVLPDFR